MRVVFMISSFARSTEPFALIKVTVHRKGECPYEVNNCQNMHREYAPFRERAPCMSVCARWRCVHARNRTWARHFNYSGSLSKSIRCMGWGSGAKFIFAIIARKSAQLFGTSSPFLCDAPALFPLVPFCVVTRCVPDWSIPAERAHAEARAAVGARRSARPRRRSREGTCCRLPTASWLAATSEAISFSIGPSRLPALARTTAHGSLASFSKLSLLSSSSCTHCSHMMQTNRVTGRTYAESSSSPAPPILIANAPAHIHVTHAHACLCVHLEIVPMRVCAHVCEHKWLLNKYQ